MSHDSSSSAAVGQTPPMSGNPNENASKPAEKEVVPLSLSLGFGVGMIGTAILLNTVTTFFPAMMATVLGQSTALAGLLLTISKLYDIFADIMIGAASDRTKSKWGRRRPYLFAGAIISSLSFFMIFYPPELSTNGLIIYMTIALIIYSTGYSLFNVPYMAMPSEIVRTYHARTSLLSYRTFFAAGGQMLALGLTAQIIIWAGGGSGGYAVMGGVMALIILAAMLGSFYGTAHAPIIERVAPPKITFGEKMRLMWANKPLVMLISAKFLQFLSLSSVISTGLLFKLNVLNIGYVGQVHFSLAQNIVTALSMPVWVKLSRMYGKRNCYLFAIVLYALTSLSWLTTGSDITQFGLLSRAVILGFSTGGMLLMSISMLPDTMEYDRQRTGMRREGVFSSLYAIVEKLGFAIGAALVGSYLALAGYIPTVKGQLVTQPEAAIQSLYFTNAIVPCILLLGSFILIWNYRLDERTLRQS